MPRLKRVCEHRLLADPTGTENASYDLRRFRHFSQPGGPIRTFIVSLLGAAAFTAGILVVRLHRVADYEVRGQIPAGERTARAVSLERLRELGF